MGSKSQAKTKAKERALAKEAINSVISAYCVLSVFYTDEID